MSEDLSGKGPGYGEQQKIGDDAISALYANKPEKWALGEIGGNDYGYDYEVTLEGPDDTGMQCIFKIQLKGTTQADARSKDRTFLSHSFDRKTLTLWHNSGVPVFVVIADLIDSRDPKEAKVYFHFANYDIQDRLNCLSDTQESLSLRVSTHQEVFRDLDVYPVIRIYLDELKEAAQLVREKNRSAGTLLSDNASIIARQDNIYTTTEITSSELEIEDIINALDSKDELNSALYALRSGDYSRTLHLVHPPSEDDIDNDPNEVAVSAYLRARALDEMDRTDEAEAMLNIAATALPDNDNIKALLVQKQLNAINFDSNGHDELQVLLTKLEGHDGPAVVNIRSKIIALKGDYDIAREMLDKVYEKKPEMTAITRIMISIVQGEWNRVLSELANARTMPTMKEQQLLLLDIFEARANFQLAIVGVEKYDDDDLVFPFSGLPGIDYTKLRCAYRSAAKAMQSGRRLNWPSSIQYILDAYSVCSALLGYGEEALAMLSDLGFARAANNYIREAVSKFSLYLDKPEIVLRLSELADGSQPYDYESCVLAIAAYENGNITKSLDYLTDELLADPSKEGEYLSFLLKMGIAADSMRRQDLLDKIIARLGQDEISRHYRAILNLATQVQHSQLRRPEAMRELFEYWEENGRPEIVGYNLLDNTNPADDGDAALIVNVASYLNGKDSLSIEHLAVFGHALLTQHKYPESISCLRKATERVKDDPRISSLLGIALELNGESAEAYQIIGRLLETGVATNSARHYFIQIAIRMGFLDQAEGQIRTALSNASSVDKKKQHLSTLYQLLLTAGDRFVELEEIVWEYGTLVNQEDEKDEGVFLIQYLTATLPKGMDIQDDHKREVQQRLERYSKRFPNSKQLWKVNIPTEGSAEEIIDTVQKAVGVTKKDLNKAEAIERKMNHGTMPVPFSWRPNRFLRNVTDIFMLWQIRQRAPFEERAYHIDSFLNDYNRNTPSNPNDYEIVLSLTSIMLLDEIGLLTSVLDEFRRIIIARDTLITLQNARNTFISGWGYAKATRIISNLQDSFEKIEHPPLQFNDEQGIGPEWHIEEKAAMLETERLYFCDDIIETIFVCHEDGEADSARPSMSTVDYLGWSESTNRMTAYEVAELLGRIIELKIGTIVEQRYLVAAIPAELQESPPENVETVMKQAVTLNSILNGIWDPSKSFNDLRIHFASTMGYLLNEGQANESVLVALWLRWLMAVRFQRKPDIGPLDKASIAFLKTLELLNGEKQIIKRLWKSYWATIKIGLGETLCEPEDIVGIKNVAVRLAAWFVSDNDAMEKAGSLFNKARMGLEEGTSHDELFNTTYVDEASERAARK